MQAKNTKTFYFTRNELIDIIAKHVSSALNGSGQFNVHYDNGYTTYSYTEEVSNINDYNPILYITVNGEKIPAESYCFRLVSGINMTKRLLSDREADYNTNICINELTDVYLGQINDKQVGIMFESNNRWWVHEFTPDQYVINFLQLNDAWKNSSGD